MFFLDYSHANSPLAKSRLGEGAPKRLFNNEYIREFQLLEPAAMVAELRLLLEYLTGLSSCVFRTNHASNYLPLKGTLPQDRERLLAMLDSALDRGRNALRPENWRAL